MRKLPVVLICRRQHALRRTPDTPHIDAVPRPQEGRCASSRTLGAGCDGRGSDARRAALLRTAKSCGPDAPTLASSWRKQFRRRRWQMSPVTGESAEETVKTIAQGRPGETGEPVVTTLVWFLSFPREAAGATGTRLSLRPLFLRGTSSCRPRALRAAGTLRLVDHRHCEGRTRRSNPLSLCSWPDGLLRGACHRARIRATRWLA
jgi:hypothetical protein